MTKIIVIGANHAGTTASNTLLDHIKDVDLTIYDRNNNISFLGCGMVLDMAAKYGIDVEYTDFEDLQKPAFMENVENAKVPTATVELWIACMKLLQCTARITPAAIIHR